MKSIPYRYVICACGTALIFISVGLLSNAFPIYFPFIMEIRGFSNTQISLLTTMRSLTALFSMFAADRYYERLNLKRGIALALCASVFSYAIYGCSSSPALYYLAALISGLGYGLGGMIPASVLIRRWFPAHTATAMGIAASGSGVASIIGPVLITSLIRRFGLSAAFLVESALMAICALPLVLLIKNEPELPQAQASGQSQALQKETASPRRDGTTILCFPKNVQYDFSMKSALSERYRVPYRFAGRRRNQSREDFSLMKFFSQGPLAGWSRAKSMVASKKPLRLPVSYRRPSKSTATMRET